MSTKKIPEYNFDDQREIMKRPWYTMSEKELIEDSKFSIIPGIFDQFSKVIAIFTGIGYRFLMIFESVTGGSHSTPPFDLMTTFVSEIICEKLGFEKYWYNAR